MDLLDEEGGKDGGGNGDSYELMLNLGLEREVGRMQCGYITSLFFFSSLPYRPFNTYSLYSTLMLLRSNSNIILS